jgi:hypothetical protein
MFYGLSEPFVLVREEVERALREQVADTIVDAIVAHDTPKFLTLGRKIGDGRHVVVTWFGTCFRARVAVRYDGGRQREQLDATLTLLCGRVDEPGKQVARWYVDLHRDAESWFNDEAFKQRFLNFRHEP